MPQAVENQEKLDLILRDTLAIERTRLANERTLLAFFRTGLSLIVTALAIFEFKEDPWYMRSAWGLIILGAAVIIFGVISYIITKRRIANSYKNEKDT
ncbi:MAG: YidH family protein [Saprospiraceae bacterium]